MLGLILDLRFAEGKGASEGAMLLSARHRNAWQAIMDHMSSSAVRSGARVYVLAFQ